MTSGLLGLPLVLSFSSSSQAPRAALPVLTAAPGLND